MTDTATARITGIHTVGVPVTDQDKALGFYTGLLGLSTRMDVPMGGGGRWIEVAAEGVPTSIALTLAKESVPAGVETGVRFTTADADAFHARLEAAARTSTRCCAGRECRRCSRSGIRTGTGWRSSSSPDRSEQAVPPGVADGRGSPPAGSVTWAAGAIGARSRATRVPHDPSNASALFDNVFEYWRGAVAISDHPGTVPARARLAAGHRADVLGGVRLLPGAGCPRRPRRCPLPG